MPNLLPQSLFSFHLAWAPHAGRLIWGLLLLTVFLFWTMLLMKRPAIKYKNRFAGPIIILLGTGGGATLVLTGKYVFDDTFSALGQVTLGWMTIYMSIIFGVFATIMAIEAKQIKLPFTTAKFLTMICNRWIRLRFDHSLCLVEHFNFYRLNFVNIFISTKKNSRWNLG